MLFEGGRSTYLSCGIWEELAGPARYEPDRPATAPTATQPGGPATAPTATQPGGPATAPTATQPGGPATAPTATARGSRRNRRPVGDELPGADVRRWSPLMCTDECGRTGAIIPVWAHPSPHTRAGSPNVARGGSGDQMAKPSHWTPLGRQYSSLPPRVWTGNDGQHELTARHPA
jgi:hypothetical protein